MMNFRNFPLFSPAVLLLAWFAVTWSSATAETLVTSYQDSITVAQESAGIWRFGWFPSINPGLPTGFSTLSSWKSLDAGDDFCLAVDQNGALFSWGKNDYGQLGNGTTSSGDQTPARVGAASDWKTVSAGRDFSTALKTNGSLWVWGEGVPGETAVTNSRVPVQVGTNTDWKFTATGLGYRMAIRNDGSLWAWGSNAHGTLGDGSVTFRSSPVRVGTTNNWAFCAAGAGTSFGIKTDGSLWVWGGVYGTGNSNAPASSSPVRLGTSNDWLSIYPSAYGDTAFAIKQDGTLWSWGQNPAGMLGLGDSENRNSPVKIGTDSDWKSVSPGRVHVVATKTDGSIWIWGTLSGTDLPLGSVPVNQSHLFVPKPIIRVFGNYGNEIDHDFENFTVAPSILGEPKPTALRIQNDGLLPLLISEISLPPGFVLDPVSLIVPPLTGAPYHIRLNADTKGRHSGIVHIRSNQADAPDLSFNIDGVLVSPHDDTDADGLNDAAEVSMSSLGFQWNYTQTALVETLFSKSKFAGLVSDRNVLDIRLQPHTPVIDAEAHTARLGFELLNSATGSSIPFEMGQLPGASNPGIKLEFTVPADREFVRILSNPPAQGSLPK